MFNRAIVKRTLLSVGLLCLFVALCGCTPISKSASNAWVLLVHSPGPRWLSPDWWRSQGFDLAALGSQGVRLLQAGVPVPYLMLDSPQGRGLLFYGEVFTSSLSPGQIGSYLLIIGEPGELLVPISLVDVQAPPQTLALTSVHLEEDVAYRSTAPLDASWLWSSLVAPQELTLSVPLTEAVSVPLTISLQVWGQSLSPQNPDHHMQVFWNGSLVDDHYWDGNLLEAWVFQAPSAHSGENALVLKSLGDTKAKVDVTWLDHVNVTWTRRLDYAGGGWARWQAGSASLACWAGLPAAEWVVLSRAPQGALRGQSHAISKFGEVLCVPQIPGSVMTLGRAADAPPPDLIRPRQSLDVGVIAESAYLMIAPQAARATLAPLVAAREAQGMAVAVVTPEQIYDTFGEGAPRAAAIRSAVLDLHARGQLRYVLLVGDTSADPRTVWAADSGFDLPTAWVRTTYVGATPSDRALVLGEDGVPLVALGRFPAATRAEVAAMVNKTLAWEPTSRLLMLHDDEAEFAALLARLAGIMPADLILGAADDTARAQALDWLAAAPGTLIYSGHGSLPLLGDEALLTRQDAAAWDGPTVVAAWTCLCATFTHSQLGLGEAWLKAPRGVVALVGPTGETSTREQAAMALAFQRALLDGEALGDALLRGWLAAQSQEAAASFVLLGDPALHPMP